MALANRQKVAVLGGTFDPVHNGHLRSAVELRQLLALTEVHLLPCHQPVHRDHPGASSVQRLDMLSLAVAHEPGLVVDPREIMADRPSYSVYTLEQMRQEYGPDCALCWVMGMDAFSSFTRWRQWQKILELSHLIVLTRPGYDLGGLASAESELWHSLKITEDQLGHFASGKILPVSLPSQMEISATYVRQQLALGGSVNYLLPEAVKAYIHEQRLYFSDTDT